MFLRCETNVLEFLSERMTHASRKLFASKSYIKRQRKTRCIGALASLAFVALVSMAVFPIYHKETTVGAAGTPISGDDPALSITSASNIASVEITPKSDNGTFAVSKNNEEVAFTVTTSNLTGYNVSIEGSDTTGSLNNSDTGTSLDTLPAAVDENTFATGSASTYSNKYGVKPNKINGATNFNYLPAPTTDASISIDTTSAPNTTATADNTYTIGLGARLDYTKPLGTYTNTFVLNAVANSISYSISYEDNSPSQDEVEPTLPAAEVGNSVTISNFTLPTDTPSRTGYTFTGWCDGTVNHVTSGDATCDGTIYPAGSDYKNFTSSTTRRGPANNIKLYAMWSANTHNVTKKYRLQNADGTWGAYTTESTTTARYESTISYERTQTDYKNSESGTNNSKASTSRSMPDSDVELTLDLYRNTFTCARQYRLENADGSWGSYTADGNTTAVRWGATCSYSKSATNYKTNGGANNSAASASYTVTTSGGSTLSVSLYRNTFTCARQYRLENADGSWGSYTADGNTTAVRWGAACSYSKTVTNYKGSSSGTNGSAGSASYTVTASGGSTLSVSLYRNTFTCARQYRLENANGTWGNYTADGNTTAVRWGAACSYSKTVTNYKGSSSGTNGSAGSASVTVVAGGGQTLSVSMYRNTFTCARRYRLENANGSWGSYTADGNTAAVRWGATCSYSKSATNYKANGGANNSAASASATVAAGGGQTLSVDLYRNTFTCARQYRLENANGTWGNYTADGNTAAVRWGAACSYSKTVTNYKGSSSGTNGSAGSASYTVTTSGGSTLSVSLYRNTFTCARRYRLQNANGTWGNYVSDGNTGAVKWGATCSYSKSVTNYKANGGANNSAASASATVAAGGGQTLSVDLYRNTFSCVIRYRYQNGSGGYGGSTVAVNATKRYQEACSWSTSSISGFNSSIYNANSYTNNSISSNIDTTVSITRKALDITSISSQIHSGWSFSQGGGEIGPRWQCWNSSDCNNSWQITFPTDGGQEAQWKPQSGSADDSNWATLSQTAYNLTNYNKINFGIWVQGYNSGAYNGDKRFIVHLCTGSPNKPTYLNEFGCTRVVDNHYNPAADTGYNFSINVSGWSGNYYIRAHTVYTQSWAIINLCSLTITVE